MNAEIADDTDLLRQYAAGSEAAFRELVQRHIGMVHATARRILNTAPHLADDVTQTVFTDLAKKAATLLPGTVLGGWLHRHAYYVALNTARAEHRRQARERTAMEINALNDNSGSDASWAQLAPVLDDALNNLNPEDRDAIVLRYLEQRDLRSVGRAIGLSEDSAQKRVSRALEKLRTFLAGRGVTVSSVLLASTLDAGAKSASLPPTLLAAVSTTALVKTAVPTSSGLLPSFNVMTNSKKILLVLTAILVLAGLGTATFMYSGQPDQFEPAAKIPAAISSLPAHAPVVEAPRQPVVNNLPKPPTQVGTPSTEVAPAETTADIGLANNNSDLQPIQIITLVGASIPLPDGRITTLDAGQTGYVFADGTVILKAPGGRFVPYTKPGTSSETSTPYISSVRALAQ